MKANELMLGDHVSHFDEKKNCVVTELRGRKVGVSFTGDDGKKKYSVLLPEMAFEPIPLTAEILEFNEFHQISTNKYVSGKITITIYGEEFLTTIKSGNARVTITIKYAHELQHALKLCGIENVIKLSKVRKKV